MLQNQTKNVMYKGNMITQLEIYFYLLTCTIKTIINKQGFLSLFYN